jgi:hypothetical protein
MRPYVTLVGLKESSEILIHAKLEPHSSASAMLSAGSRPAGRVRRSAFHREAIDEAGAVGSVDEPGHLEGFAVLVEAGVQDFEDGHAGR